MKLEARQDGLWITEAFSGVGMEQPDGNQLGICMRDDTFEINVIPKNGKSQWFRVDMQSLQIRPLTSAETKVTPLAVGDGHREGGDTA